MEGRHGQAQQAVGRRSLGPQVEILHRLAERAQFPPALLYGLPGWQFVPVMEREQVHLVPATQFPEQVESALQDTAVRRVRHDLGHVEDAHEQLN